MAHFRRILELFEHGVVIPRTAGVVYDAISLIISIVGSLFPAWNPYRPIAVPPAAANENNNDENNG